MAAGTARTTTGVTISIARDPALVRTVRLVAAAVARRTGHDEDFVEEVRLAVGEACALMIGEVAEPDATDPVMVSMSLDDALRVDVTSQRPVSVDDPPNSDIDGVEPWALLRGLIDDFRINRDHGATTVSMTWHVA